MSNDVILIRDSTGKLAFADVCIRCKHRQPHSRCNADDCVYRDAEMDSNYIH